MKNQVSGVTRQLEASLLPLADASALPPWTYTDPRHYDVEVDRIFRHSWLSVGRIDQAAARGDYFTVDLFGEPLVIVRDLEGELRAMSRVCRHRWMPVVAGAGNRKAFQCPYHLWTYALNGRLIGAPEMHQARGFDKADCVLPQLRVEVWQGWIFVNFDQTAAPLAPLLSRLSEFVAPYRLSEFTTLEPLVYDSDWNWKLMVENFMESYHHPGVHPDSLQPIFPAAGTYALDSEGPYSILRNPAGDRSRPLGSQLPHIDGLSMDLRTELVVCAVYPYHLFAMLPDSMVYYNIEPRGVDRFTLRVYPCVPAAIARDPHYREALADMRATVDYVHQQDILACRGVYAGLKSRMARAGRLSHLEKALWQFNQFVATHLKDDAGQA